MTAISDASDGFLGVALALDMTFIDRNGPKEASVSNSLLLTAMRCLVGAVAALPLAVSADVFRVGQTGAACTHRNIQAAINAADANPGADEIRITRDVSTSGEPYWLTNGLTIDTDDALNEVGEDASGRPLITTTYRTPTAFQNPRSVRFSVQYDF